MKNKLKTIMLLSCMTIAPCLIFSQTMIDLTTGRQNGSTNLIATGSYDDTWQVKAPGGSFVNIKCMDGYLNSNPTSQWPQISGAKWITPAITSSNYGDVTTVGSWQYRMTFTTSCGSINNAKMTLENMGADNMVSRIELNGTVIGNYQAGTGGTTPMIANQITSIPVVNGANTLVVFVTNNPWVGTTNGTTWTGLLLKGFITIAYNNTPVPSFNANANYCEGSPLQFTGSASPATATKHFWGITECDPYWQVTPGGYQYSEWINGNPGSYTFPTAPCGKYYRVVLAVQNACLSWAETAKLIYVPCKPVIDLRGDLNVCYGSPTTLCAVVPVGISVSWNFANGLGTFNEYCATVLPVTNSNNNTLTLTNTSSGCVSSTTFPLNTYLNNPDFNRTTTAVAGQNYYTISATPSNLNDHLVLGFAYSWYVEEVIETSPNVFVSVSNTDVSNPWCWQTYPAQTALNFNGYNYNGTNNFICNSTLGQFTLGKKYRITRGTRNAYCDWAQIAYVVYNSGAMRSSDGTPNIIFQEDKNAPDRRLINNSIIPKIGNDDSQNIAVFPNPTNDIVNINSKAEIKSIQVTTINGQLLLDQKQVTEIDLSKLPSGMYFFIINTEKNQKTIKVIKE